MIALKRLEKDYEDIGKELRQYAKELDIEMEYLKLSIPGRRGWPDRMIMLPNKEIFFVEWKQPGLPPGKLQNLVHERIRSFGNEVFLLDQEESIDVIKRKMEASSRANSGG